MNSITEKLARSWQLFRSSVLVIRAHPRLLVFPIVTGLLTLSVAAFFLAPVAVVLFAPHWLHSASLQAAVGRLGILQFGRGTPFHGYLQPLTTFLFAGVYLLNLFLASLSSVAFSAEILEALAGHPVSIRRGLESACRRWKSVLLWSLLAGSVGLLIRAVEDKLSFVGRLVAGLLGMAWSVASIFAIPVLVRETSVNNPFEVLSRSAKTIKATWGEMLVGYFGLQGMNLLFFWCSLLYWAAAGLLAYLLSTGWVLLGAAAPWLVSLVTYGYLSNIAGRVYLCALYLYAADGVVASPFDASMLSRPFKTKQG